MANAPIMGTFVQYELQKRKRQDGTPFEKHVFTMRIDGGVVDISIGSEEYLEKLLNQYKVNSVEDFIRVLESIEVELFFVDNGKYLGHSFTESFKTNNKVNMMGELVEITDVIDTPFNVTFTLADGTVARRSLSKQIGEILEPNIDKRRNFIRDNVPFAKHVSTYDLTQLVGHKMSYIWNTFGDIEYLKILEITEDKVGATSGNESIESALDDLFGK